MLITVDAGSLNQQIEKAQEKLRELDGSLAQIGGRPPGSGPGLGIKRRISDDGPNARRIGGGVGYDNGFAGGRRRVESGPGLGIKRRISDDGPNARRIGGGVGYDNGFAGGRRRVDMGVKRGRMEDADEDFDGDEDDYDDRPKRSLLSTVALPAIETKSRDDKIKELEGAVQKDVKQRNRRMFSNLLMGTLQRFQKDEKKIQSVEKIQADKQRAVEAKIEDEKQQDREKARSERMDLMNQRREQEREVRNLQRKRALIQYAETKLTHYKNLQNFIGTASKPTLFFLPAKHTLRSLELLKQSSETIDSLIKSREETLATDLAAEPPADRRRERGDNERDAGGDSGHNGRASTVVVNSSAVNSRGRARSRSYSRSDSDYSAGEEEPAVEKEEVAREEGEKGAAEKESVKEVEETKGAEEDTEEVITLDD